MAKRKPKPASHAGSHLEPPALPVGPIRVSGAPGIPGDYRIKLKDEVGEAEGDTRPAVHTVDSVDDDYLYGRPHGFFGMAGFKIGRLTVAWHEPLP